MVDIEIVGVKYKLIASSEGQNGLRITLWRLHSNGTKRRMHEWLLVPGVEWTLNITQQTADVINFLARYLNVKNGE